MTDTPRAHRLALAVAALALAGPPLAADLVVLRNGQELRGRVRAQGDQVRIDLDLGGTVVVAKGDVARLEVDEAPAQATAEAAAISAELLGRLEARERLHALIDALGAEKARDRAAAEQQLVQAGRAALPTVRPLLVDGSAAQRAGALRILAAVGDPSSIPAIRDIAHDTHQQDLHAAAADALADIGGHALAPLLTDLLVNGKDEAVQLAALKRLAALRAPFAAPFVVEALGSRALAPTARAAVARWLDPVALPYLLPHLDEGSRESRKRVAEWVVGFVTPAAAADYARLFEAYKDDSALAKPLREGMRRLLTEFPVLGAIDLLNAPQAPVKTLALEWLKRQFPHKQLPRNEDRAREPRFWQAERAQAGTARVVVVPVGSAPPGWVREIAGEVGRSLKGAGIPVEFERKPLAVPGGDGARVDGRPILAALDLRQLGEWPTARVIGVTPAEVRMPGYATALAPTRPGGAVLVSLAPLGRDRDRVVRRARRLALHALATSLGLPPSADPQCPSSALYEASDLDAKAPTYAAATQALLAPLWQAERGRATFLWQQAAQQLARLGRDRGAKALHAEAACLYERALLTTQAVAEWKAYQQLDPDPAVTALLDKRIALLERTGQWLIAKGIRPKP